MCHHVVKGRQRRQPDQSSCQPIRQLHGALKTDSVQCSLNRFSQMIWDIARCIAQ
ncbi:hypothetical protein RISK_001109 [Rhodopirellula islandica]|uniref:Uncharacterized protein n=1 Tax=Rhodopirellula islandica TaxID=595434 RepID=A0A0J1BJQ8_RHOIS|nr:hypothetical protein RISK_001109 [Rhodopirellula islandica]